MPKASEHPWFKIPMWERRLHGFVSYALSAVVALFDPVRADVVMYKVLKEQFAEIEDSEKGE